MTSAAMHENRPRQFRKTDTLPFVKAPQAERPVELRRLDVSLRVTGIYAETTQEMHLFNPNSRLLSGELIVPLPDAAVVCGYALDIDGAMRPGVIVPKQEARRIFEAEERKGLDPGLVEQVQGNVYRIRVYPLPPHGTRIVSITYLTRLVITGQEATCHLPLSHAAQVDEVSLRVEVTQAPSEPVITGGQGNLSMTGWNQIWLAEARLTKGMPTEDLFVRLPDLPEEVVMIERTPAGEHFFAVSTPIRAAVAAPGWQPKKIAIAWDASGNRDETTQELQVLRALCARWQSCRVVVQVFRDQLGETAAFDIESGDATVLIDYLSQRAHDGATNLGCLDLASVPETGCEAWLLFSDGLDTVSAMVPAIAELRVITITSQRTGNPALLRHLAEQSGGISVNLMQTSVAEAVDRICSGGEAVKIGISTGCQDLLSETTGGRVTVLGRLIDREASITITQPDGSISSPVVTMPQARAGTMVARQWAGRKIEMLAVLPGAADEEMLRLARTYGVVSPETSLLVLEDLEQYLEYGVEPPEALPAMRAQYHERLREQSKQERARQHEHLETVVALWQQRVAWWEKEYKYSPQIPRDGGDRRAGAYSSAPMPDDSAEVVHEALDDMDEAPMFFPCTSEPGELHQDSLDDFTSDAELENESDAGPQDTALQRGSVITLQGWSPDARYTQELAAVPEQHRYARYLEMRAEHHQSPSFFLDCGDFFFRQGDRERGIRILSNLLEIGLQEPALMRICAWRLQQEGELDRAITLFEQVASIRDDEPQSHRDLALALADRWQRDNNPADLKRAVDLLYTVVCRSWDRFPEIELIALMELNRLLFFAACKGTAVTSTIDERLIKNLDLDLRINLSWDADNTDVDLHVFEPTGEHAYYGHQLTAIGGLVSRDVRDGYGPEEYVLRRARSGAYTIKAHYFSSWQQKICGPCTVTATVFTNFARENETKRVITLRLDHSGDDYVVGTVDIGASHGDTEKLPYDHLLKQFSQLRSGMTINEVTAAVGQPTRLRNQDGVDSVVLGYLLPDGIELEVILAPHLIKVQRIMEGAAVDLDLIS